MKYRGEIDGLRALAVIPVILFHAGFEIFSGGFVGVDVFFVISGYLITTILIEDIEKNRFSLINFYGRRARRILPALSFVVLVSTVLAWIILEGVSLNKYGNSLIGIGLFASNVVFWRQEGYFEESAELNPLLHTWSLAVEEQYYVIFPIFLFFAWRFGKSKVFFMIGVFLVISLLISEWGWRNQATANFYLAPTRAWELLTGSIAAFIIHQRGVYKNDLLALLGIASIFFAIFFYDKTTPFPSLYTLIPVFGAVLIILYGDKETIVSKVLNTGVLVKIGLISYSSYLWHQPLFAFTRRVKGKLDLQIFTDLVLILITFIIGYLSWKYIEKPFRKKNFLSNKIILRLSFLVLIIIVLLGIVSKFVTRGNEYTLAKTLSKNEFIYFENMDERKFVEGRLIFDLKKADHILVGSSRIMQINSDIIGEPILNLSVSGASVEDDLAFLLESVAKLSPKKVYISADPWLLNKFDRQNRFKSIDELYQYWLTKLNTNDYNLKPFYENNLANKNKKPSLTFLHKLIQQINLKNLGIPIDNEVEAVAKKSYDGSHIYNEEKVNNKADLSREFDGILNYGMKDFSYDERAEIILAKLISFLNIRGFDVNLILVPYHPELYKRMKIEKPIFIKLENEFRRIANQNEINVIGSYDPSVVGCYGEEFYDGMHPTGACMYKTMNIKRINE